MKDMLVSEWVRLCRECARCDDCTIFDDCSLHGLRPPLSTFPSNWIVEDKLPANSQYQKEIEMTLSTTTQRLRKAMRIIKRGLNEKTVHPMGSIITRDVVRGVVEKAMTILLEDPNRIVNILMEDSKFMERLNKSLTLNYIEDKRHSEKG